MAVLLYFLCCAVGLFLLFWWWRKRMTAQSEWAITPVATPYHSVSIGPAKNGCTSAKRHVNQRFLAREAPRLPLPDCDALVCHCRYSHFDDRREEDRRNSHALRRGLSSGPSNTEYRSGSDRRRSRKNKSGQHRTAFFEDSI